MIGLTSGLGVSPTVTTPKIVQYQIMTWGTAWAIGGVYVIYLWGVIQMGDKKINRILCQVLLKISLSGALGSLFHRHF